MKTSYGQMNALTFALGVLCLLQVTQCNICSQEKLNLKKKQSKKVPETLGQADLLALQMLELTIAFSQFHCYFFYSMIKGFTECVISTSLMPSMILTG